MVANKDNTLGIYQGSGYSRTLSNLQITLLLVQTACTLALEGTNRVSASDLVDRLSEDTQITLTPATAGQILSSLGIGKSLIHGRSRLVLDANQLQEVRQRVAGQCEEQLQRLQSAITGFQVLPAQIKALQKEWQQVLTLETQRRQLARNIAEKRQQLSQLGNLENQWQLLQPQVQKVFELEKDIESLNARIKKLPSLEKKKAALEENLRTYNNEASQLSQREARLGQALQEFKVKNAWADLHTLNYNIQLKREELEQISEQLGAKRSLLDKLMGRHKGGA